MIKPRQIVPEDIPWIIEVSREAYDDRMESEAGGMAWLASTIGRDRSVTFRTDNAYCLAHVGAMPYQIHPRGEIVLLAGRQVGGVAWELVALGRQAIEWLSQKGVVSIRMGENAGRDISAVARRIGLRNWSRTYIL